MCAGVRFAHVVYLPAVLATLDSMCMIKHHRLSVLKDGCVSTILSRLNRDVSTRKPSHQCRFKVLEQYGHRLICSLMWQDETITKRSLKGDSITKDDHEHPHTHVDNSNAMEQSFAQILHLHGDGDKVVDMNSNSKHDSCFLNVTRLTSGENELCVEDSGNAKIILRTKNSSHTISQTIPGDIVPVKVERPELVETGVDFRVASVENIQEGQKMNIAVDAPKKQRSDVKKSRRHKKDKDQQRDSVSMEVVKPPPTLTESELRVLRKKERRIKQQGSSLKLSLPRS